MPGIEITLANMENFPKIYNFVVCFTNKSGTKINTEKKQVSPIEVVPYNPKWPTMFEAEKKLIQSALGDNCIAIHHIGSTSVLGLAAKPKIDIIALAKDREKAIKSLGKVGYTHAGEWNIPLKCGFTKRNGTSVNLHMFFEENHPEIELNLRFRDYLRTNPDVRDEYAALKLSILGDETAHQRVGKLSFPVYTLKKSAFISKIIKNIGFNRLRVLKCITENEWEAVKSFRRDYFHRLGIGDPIRENLEDGNHEHFLLYRGTEIIGYADIRIFSKKAAMLCVFEIHSKNESLWFIALIKKWAKVHGYKFLNNIAVANS